MGYEIEMSYNIKQHVYYLSNLLTKSIELAENNHCEKHFQFTDNKGYNKIKCQTPFLVVCFENNRFT